MALYEVLADGTIVPKAGKTVGNSDCLRTELLWTNSNTTSTFNEQTINVDLSKYDGYRVLFKFHTTDASTFVQEFIKTNGVLTALSYNSIFRRNITYSDNGLTFSSMDGYKVADATRIQNNDYLIPYQIYGILKTPAMIYTGKELFAGNGISIEDGVVSSNGLEYVGYYSADGNVSVDIDLDKYDYFAFVRINTNSSTDVNLGIFPNTSFNVYTNDKSASSTFSYCYLFYAKSFSTSLYITYNQNNDGYVRVYPSDRGVTFASSTSKPTKLTTYSSGTVTIANIILYRRKK